jgi:hypothetical protein
LLSEAFLERSTSTVFCTDNLIRRQRTQSTFSLASFLLSLFRSIKKLYQIGLQAVHDFGESSRSRVNRVRAQLQQKIVRWVVVKRTAFVLVRAVGAGRTHGSGTEVRSETAERKGRKGNVQFG